MKSLSFLKKALFAALCIGTFSFAVAAAEAEIPDEHLKSITEAQSEKINVLCIGNSILMHGSAESIGWSGNWGMAASAEDKDYYHLLQQKVADEGYTNVSWSRVGVATLERTIDKRMDYDYASEISQFLAPSVKAANPDIIILQIGENVDKGPTRASYEHALTKIAEYFVSQNPDVQVIFCMPFWYSSAKSGGVLDAAKATGFTYANLSQFDNNENKATGLFTHGGVANHPGDKGMANIADEIFKQLKVVLYKKYVDPAQVEVKMDGQYVDFDVPAQLIDDRTMIPLRGVAEAFGAEVAWEEATETVTIRTETPLETTEIVMKLGDAFFTKNGERVSLDVPALTVNDRAMVPARAISEALDCKVDWDDKTQTVLITVPEQTEAYPKSLNDPCNSLTKSAFFSSNATLTVKEDEDSDHGKVIYVTPLSADTKAWTYIWAKMDLVPGKTYTLEADVKFLGKDAKGNAMEAAEVNYCMHFDGTDHGVKVMKVNAADGWTHISMSYSLPENMVPVPGDDRIGIYANPKGDVPVGFVVDNIVVKIAE